MTPPRAITVLMALLCAFALAVPACSSSPKGKKRKRTVLMTMSDDQRVGQQAASDVKAQIGVLERSPLAGYVERVGRKVLRGVPRRSFRYEFYVVDQMEPNAFALPGGYIFISRGLLALANDEDEVACVIGHEIVHSAHRHAAQQQALAGAVSALAMPWYRAGKMAGYSRDMEREADDGGQKLCAAAGYDPMGMATFMQKLDQRERLLVGHARNPTFLDTHPGSQERSAINAMRARELRWKRDPALGDTRVSHLREIEGMVLGDRPQTGIFEGNRFLHPELGFAIRFPDGWQVQNSAGAVGAVSRRHGTMIYLSADLPSGELEMVADQFAEKTREETGFGLVSKKRVKVGDIDGVRYEFQGRGGTGFVTLFPFGGTIWRITAVGPSRGSRALLGRSVATVRSFAPLTEAQRRKALEVDRLLVVKADPGEDLERLSRRSRNLWDPSTTALINGIFVNHRFDGGELIKISRMERAAPPRN